MPSGASRGALVLGGQPAGHGVGGGVDVLRTLSEPPITWATAIASPTARPNPSITAATRPPVTCGIAIRAPSPSVSSRAPSRRASGRGDAREELAADRRHERHHHERQDEAGGRGPTGEGNPSRNGMKPRWAIRNGSMCSFRNGPSTRTPRGRAPRSGWPRAARPSCRPEYAGPAERARSGRARCDRQRHGNKQRHERGDQRPEDRSAAPYVSLTVFHTLEGEEPRPELLNRGLGLAHDLDDEEHHEHREAEASGRDGLEGTSPARHRRRPLRGTWTVGVSVAIVGSEGGGAGTVGEGGAGASPCRFRSRSWRSAPGRLPRSTTAASDTQVGPERLAGRADRVLQDAFSVEALGESCGTMTYVNVASGYASAEEAGGFTSEIDPSGFVVPTLAAAITDFVPGSG